MQETTKHALINKIDMVCASLGLIVYIVAIHQQPLNQPLSPSSSALPYSTEDSTQYHFIITPANSLNSPAPLTFHGNTWQKPWSRGKQLPALT